MMSHSREQEQSTDGSLSSSSQNQLPRKNLLIPGSKGNIPKSSSSNAIKSLMTNTTHEAVTTRLQPLNTTTLGDVAFKNKPQTYIYDYETKEMPTIVKIHDYEDIDPPQNICRELSKIMVKPNIIPSSKVSLTAAIETKFNKFWDSEKKPVVATTAIWRGYRLDHNQFLLVARNGIPQLCAWNKDLLIVKPYLNFTKKIEVLGKYKLDDIFFGYAGWHVLNVPEGMFALVVKDGVNWIYQDGIHVIHATDVKFDKNKDLVLQTQPHIDHGNIHLIRVPVGQIAKVTVNSIPLLLDVKTDPKNPFYVYDTPSFQFEGFENETNNLITHNSLKRLILKANQIAVISRNGIIELIKPSAERPDAIYLKKNTDEVKGFINTNVQSRVFPIKEKKKGPESYAYFNSLDTIKLGIKIHARYQLLDVDRFINKNTEIKLDQDNIGVVVENYCLMAIGKIIRDKELRHAIKKMAAVPTEQKNPASEYIDAVDTAVLTEIKQLLINAIKTVLENHGIELESLAFEIKPILGRDQAYFSDNAPNPEMAQFMEFASQMYTFFRQNKLPTGRRRSLLPADVTALPSQSNETSIPNSSTNAVHEGSNHSRSEVTPSQLENENSDHHSEFNVNYLERPAL